MLNRTWVKFLGIGLAGSLALAAAAVAQQEGRHRGREHGFHGRGMGSMGPGGPMRMLRELDLTEDQRQRIRALFEEVESTGVPERLRQARESLHDAIESGADETTLRQQASELGEVEGDAAVEWARVRTRLHEILTVEQKEELERMKQEAEERMEMIRRHREERKTRRGKSGAAPL